MSGRYQYQLSDYKEIEQLGDNQGVFLVRNRYNNKLYIEKKLDIYSLDVYKYLQDNHIKNTPVIYETTEKKGKLFVIEEYVTGTLLNEHIKKYGSLSADEAIDITKKLCCIIKELHECDPPIIHRDIKPENIILKKDGTVVLLDMNAAKFFDENSTKDTYLLGTYGYAAPEQYGFGKSGVSSDIYGIGKVLNEMLTGDINTAPSGNIKIVIDKCTEMDPKNRYQSVGELMKGLNRKDILSTVDYDKLPGFRTDNLWQKILAFMGYVLFTLLFLKANFEGITNLYEIWFYRLTYYITFVIAFLFCRNYRNIWNMVGISRVENRLVKITVIVMMEIGILFIGMTFASTLGLIIRNVTS